MKKYLLPLIVLLALIVRLINLNQSFWLDEAAQVLESVRPLSQQLNIVADFHPPLYHILLHFWMSLGTSEVWLRLPSVVLGVGCVLLIIKIAEQLGYKKAALLSGLFVAVSPFHIWYSQEVRPYMMFSFVSLMSTYFLLKKSWVLYILFCILAMYTNYFAPFVFLSQLAYVFVCNKTFLKKTVYSLLIVGAFFLAWMPFFLEQLKVGTSGIFQGWSEVVSVNAIKVIPLTFAKFIYGKGSIDDNVMYMLVLSPVLIIFLYSVIILAKEKKDWPTLVFFFIPLLFVTFITSIVAVAAPQRLLFILPFFALIIAIPIERLPRKEKYFCILLVLLVSFGGVWQYYTDQKVQREKWREAISYIDKMSEGQGVALFVFPDPFAPYYWYKTNNSPKGIGVASEFNYKAKDKKTVQEKIKNQKTVYVYQYLTGLTDPQGKVLSDVKDSGFSEKKVLNFEGVGFINVMERL